MRRTTGDDADGGLDTDEGEPGVRAFMVLGAGLNPAEPRAIDPPPMPSWTGRPLEATACDTAWIATLQDVAADETVSDVTAGWLRASLRAVDDMASRGGPHRRADHLPDSVDSQRPTIRSGPPHTVGPRQRRPGPRHTGDHELPPRQYGHQQPQHHQFCIPAPATRVRQLMAEFARRRQRDGVHPHRRSTATPARGERNLGALAR